MSSSNRKNITAGKCIGFVPLNFRQLRKTRVCMLSAFSSCCPSGDDLAPEPEQPQESSDIHLDCFFSLGTWLRL